VLLERDRDVPEFAMLMAERGRAAQLLERVPTELADV
jgi:uncharacterized protein (UPF0276 family)